jgi:hypothetical protein
VIEDARKKKSIPSDLCTWSAAKEDEIVITTGTPAGRIGAKLWKELPSWSRCAICQDKIVEAG